MYVVATANPEDYTNRGRIITPLKDRFGSQIRTHYPQGIEDEMAIVEQERRATPKGVRVEFPQYMREIIAEITSLARRSPEINQRSGVSVRVSIANYEIVVSNAVRRCILLGEVRASPRISDLPYIVASSSGKIELETFEEGRESKVIGDIANKAVFNVFGRYFEVMELSDVIRQFDGGLVLETGSEVPSKKYVDMLAQIDGLFDSVKRLGASRRKPESAASAVEFIFEGLHLNRKLNRDPVESGFRYRS